MYMIEVVYGMESYQQERKEFDSYIKAAEYFIKWKVKNPISIKFYELKTSYSNNE